MMKRALLLVLGIIVFQYQSQAQVYGEPIVSWDFADGIPSDWIQGITSTTEQAHWEYRGPSTVPDFTEGARGSCSAIAAPIGSTTQSNGFVIFDSNYWDDAGNICGVGFGTGADPAPHTAWLITNPIDFTDVTAAVLTFQQQYRHFNNTTTKVQISVDGGENWTDIITNSGVQSLNTVWASFNISSIITGQSSVQFKFIFNGSYYWWLLDDITVFVPNDNDLMLTSFTYTENTGPESLTANFELEYDQYPLSMIPPFKFKSVVHNVGADSQTGVIMNTTIIKDQTTEIYNTNSNPANIPASVIQNMQIINPFTTPAQVGDYMMYCTISQNQSDQNLLNNLDSLDYSITEYTYAKDEGAMENTYIQSAFYDEYQMMSGNFYEAFVPNQYCHSLKVAIAEGTPVGKEIYGVIYNQEYDSLLASTATYILNAADLNSPGDENFVTLYFDTPFEMENDSLYFVAVTETDSTGAFFVARSGDSYSASSLVRYPSVNATFPSAKSFMVRMNIFPLNANPGCMDPSAMNFNANADVDDNSCKYPGCTNETADNFTPGANFDDGSCIIGGCMNSDAANYNPFANYDNGSCIFLGCTDPEALNFEPGSNLDDGTCFYLFTHVEVQNISGCPPLTITVNNQNEIYENSNCAFIVNDNSINQTCEPQFTYVFDEPGEYDLTYTITVGNAEADTTIHISVFEVPQIPIITYAGFGNGIACNNCGSNENVWYLNGEIIQGASGNNYDIVNNDIHENGYYNIITTNEFGCSEMSDSIAVAQALFATSSTEGCAPFTLTVGDLTDHVENMSNVLNNGNGEVIIDFDGETTFVYETAGAYTVSLETSLAEASSVFAQVINVYSAATPVLEHNEIDGTVDCINCDQFETIQWNIDGEIIDGGNSQPDGNHVYGISVTTAQGCSANALLIIENVDESAIAGFVAYPNPVRDMLNLNAELPFVIELYDNLSRRINISEGMKPATTHQIDLSALSGGLYTMVVKSDSKVFSRMIEVAH